jgi:hypothetical protein
MVMSLMFMVTPAKFFAYKKKSAGKGHTKSTYTAPSQNEALSSNQGPEEPQKDA